MRKIFERGFIVLIVIFVSVAFVRATDFWIGENQEEGPCPADMVFIDTDAGGFCIDRYEASAGEECAFSNPDNQDKTRINLNNSECKPVSEKGVIPWRFISQDQAKVACSRAGKRLATNQQWFQAALGSVDLNRSWTGDDCNVDKNWDSNPGETGSGVNCVSSFGVYDMIGNVWEWVDGVSVDGEFDGKKLPKSGFVVSSDGGSLPGGTDLEEGDENYNMDYFWTKDSDMRAMARGGYWNNGSDAGLYSVYNVVPPSYAGEGIGFRCVR